METINWEHRKPLSASVASGATKIFSIPLIYPDWFKDRDYDLISCRLSVENMEYLFPISTKPIVKMFLLRNCTPDIYAEYINVNPSVLTKDFFNQICYMDNRDNAPQDDKFSVLVQNFHVLPNALARLRTGTLLYSGVCLTNLDADAHQFGLIADIQLKAVLL